tara:strand:- start:2344 stop:3387 length:1044 start_codon:yes stop_codon:yes gene_type:complete
VGKLETIKVLIEVSLPLPFIFYIIIIYMKIVNYFFAFVIITSIGVLYDRYLKKYDWDSTENNNKLIKHYLLNEGDNDKPILWIHTKNEINSRNWISFNSRNTKEVNQGYIEMCINSIMKHCSNSFKICLINDESFSKLLPTWTIELNKLAEPIKSHVRQLAFIKLLHFYGGLCLPNSTIVLKDLKPLMTTFLTDKDFFAVETLARNKSADTLKFIPSTNIMGARKQSSSLKQLLEYTQIQISKDNTSEMDFVGNLDIKLFDMYKKNEINVMDAKLFGTKDNSNKEILIDDLMSSLPIKLSDDCYCIVIPKDELLKRTKYNWFVRLNKNQIINSDNNISNFLMYSLQK